MLTTVLDICKDHVLDTSRQGLPCLGPRAPNCGIAEEPYPYNKKFDFETARL